MIPLTNMMKYCARRCVSVGVGCWVLEVRKSGISDDIKVPGQGRSPLVRLVCNPTTPGKTPLQAKHTVGSGCRDRPHFINADRVRWLFFFGVVTFFGIPDVDLDSSLSLLFLSLSSLLLMCGELITPRLHDASLLFSSLYSSSRRSLVNRDVPRMISGWIFLLPIP
jgi:hypothetical protein